MSAMNLLPRPKKKRKVEIASEDKKIIFAFLAILILLVASYVYASTLVSSANVKLMNLQTEVLRLKPEQTILEQNRALAAKSASLEANILTAVGLQVDTNAILKDIGRDLQKSTRMTSIQMSTLNGALIITLSDKEFLNLVRSFTALSSDVRFKNVSIQSYQVPMAVQQNVKGAANQELAIMGLTLTWVGGKS